MIVISMTNCPPKVRGDLSKWLMEINTGVYVGQVNARVREALWKRVCENIAEGQATLVYSTNNEQHMEFRVHNTNWKPVDYDGLWLIKHPDVKKTLKQGNDVQTGYSNAAKYQKGKRRREKNQFCTSDYVILDLETTGLQPDKDSIIEIGALRIIHGKRDGEFQTFIKIDEKLPKEIIELTGITDGLLEEKGVEVQKAISELLNFVSDMNVVIYNASFDCAFLEEICRKNQLAMLENYVVDGLGYIRKRVKGIADYKLETVARHLEVEFFERHRAINDCRLLYEIFLKLNPHASLLAPP